jgi:hypothetical protein
METLYPHLHSYAKNENITLNQAINEESLYNLFHLPLSVIAHQELHDLQDDLNDLSTTNQNDTWNLRTSNKNFSTKKIYRASIGDHDKLAALTDIWKTCNLPRQKFFAWLLLHRRLNTKDLMLRKNFGVQYKECILCDIDDEETIMQLFFECCFSQSFCGLWG